MKSDSLINSPIPHMKFDFTSKLVLKKSKLKSLVSLTLRIPIEEDFIVGKNMFDFLSLVDPKEPENPVAAAVVSSDEPGAGEKNAEEGKKELKEGRLTAVFFSWCCSISPANYTGKT